MGSKGSQTTNTSQNSTYVPTGAGYLANALNSAQTLGQGATPQIPTAPVAGLTGQQQQAFGLAGNTGIQNPYLQQAQNLFSPSGINQYYNPAVQSVTNQLQNVFGQQQQQNNANLIQSAGGVGADRIAVGQGNLANQQGLAAGQVYSGLWNSAAQQAQSAAYGTAGLGAQAQQANTTDIQNLLTSGGLQQQQQQAQLNAPYQQQLAQLALPYQLQQFYGQQIGALAPALGGTTFGAGTSTSTYNPSLLSQITGLGAIGLGAFGKGTGGAVPYARGGAANPFDFAGGGPIDISQGLFSGNRLFRLPDQAPAPAQTHVPQINLNTQAPNLQQQGQSDMRNMASLSKGLMSGYNNSTSNLFGMSNEAQDALQDMFDARGGRIGYARGGMPNPYAGLPHFDDGGGSSGDGSSGDGSDGSAGGDGGVGGGIGSDAGAVGEGGLGGLAGAPGIGSDAGAMAASMSAALGNMGNTGASESESTAQSPGLPGSPNDAQTSDAASIGASLAANPGALAAMSQNAQAQAAPTSAAPSAALANASFGTQADADAAAAAVSGKAIGTIDDNNATLGNMNPGFSIAPTLAQSSVEGFSPSTVNGPSGMGGFGFGFGTEGLGPGSQTASFADPNVGPAIGIVAAGTAPTANGTVAGEFGALNNSPTVGSLNEDLGQMAALTGPPSTATAATSPGLPAATSPGLPGALAGALAGLTGAVSNGVGAVSQGATMASNAIGNVAQGVNDAVGTGLNAVGNLPGPTSTAAAVSPGVSPDESVPAETSVAPMSFADTNTSPAALANVGSPSIGGGGGGYGSPSPFTPARNSNTAQAMRLLAKLTNGQLGNVPYIPQGYARGGSPNPYRLPGYDDGGDIPFELGDNAPAIGDGGLGDTPTAYQRLADMGLQRGQIDAAAQQAGPAAAAIEERAQAAPAAASPSPFEKGIANIESSGRGFNGPRGRYANELYQQYPAFVQQYGAGTAGIQNYAKQVLKHNPNATFGDFYGGYVTGTGNPATAKLQNLLTTTQPGARGAYANMMNKARSGEAPDPSTPLASLIGGSAPGGDPALGYAPDDKKPEAVLNRAANGQPAGGLPPAITQPPPGAGSLGPPGAGPPGGIPGLTDPRQFPAIGAAAAQTTPDTAGGGKGASHGLFGKEGYISNMLHDPARMALIMGGLSAFTPQGFAGGFGQGMQLMQSAKNSDIAAKRLEQEANFHADTMKHQGVQEDLAKQKLQYEMGQPKTINTLMGPRTAFLTPKGYVDMETGEIIAPAAGGAAAPAGSNAGAASPAAPAAAAPARAAAPAPATNPSNPADFAAAAARMQEGRFNDPRLGQQAAAAPQAASAPAGPASDGTAQYGAKVPWTPETTATLAERARMPRGSAEARDEGVIKYLAKRNPGYAQQVRDAADYKLDPSHLFSMKGDERQNFDRMVRAYDPTYNATDFPEIQRAKVAFGTGPQGNALRSLDAASEHIEQVKGMVSAMKNGDWQLFNRIKNTFDEQRGKPDVTNAEAAAEIAGDEIVKSILGNGAGALADREGVHKAIDVRSKSPAQLEGVMDTYTGLMGGQMKALKRQYERTTRLHNFDDEVLSDAGRRAIAMADKHKAPVFDPSDPEQVKLHANDKFEMRGGGPSLEEFIPRARAANPGMSDADLKTEWQKRYGGQ